MSVDIKVDADIMLQHASRMQQLAQDAAEAAAAIQSINLGGGAFGLLCAWMVPPVAVVSGAVAEHINGAEGVLERTGNAMRAVVRDFEGYEDAVAQAARSIEGRLG
ncbi:hypothetical protein [Microbacterium sp. RG1]|uniref:hypothetical protein n=1 Tax=Microbacterium sp. RG1 TaxID=2489212 RepID=UPI0010CA5D7C|nr:hypothetical protein [Microbacterium sp. RG1]QCQ17194.1 hypothetical protein EHF32_10925 [Microbacterium sp. RG1]